MDSIAAIGLGLGLRLLVDVVSHQSLRVGGTLVGLWEGVVLYHFLNKMPRSFDPYVGYGLRLFIDFLFTESLSRLTVVMLWTGLGMVLSDIGPILWSSTGLKSLFRRLRRDLSGFRLPAFPFFTKSPISSRVRFYERPPPSQASSVSSVQTRSIAPAATRPLRNSRRPPGAFPGDWSESDTDTVMTVLPVPPPSNAPSPRDRPGPISTQSSEPSDDADDAELPADPVVIPEIPTEDLVQADGERNAEQEHTPTSHPEELPVDPTEPPAEPDPVQPPLGDIPEMTTAETGDKGKDDEKDGDRMSSLIPTTTFDPPLDPPPPFEEVEGEGQGGDSARNSGLYAETDRGRPESVLSALSTNSLVRRGEMCRREALDVEKEREAFINRRKEALEDHKFREAFLLQQEIADADDRAQKLHARAAERYFRGRNVNTSEEKQNIDVRGLHHPEAKKQVFARLRDLLGSDGTQLRIRVGGEKQPIDQKHILKSNLLSDLADHHMPAEVDPYDSSYIVVNLPSS